MPRYFTLAEAERMLPAVERCMRDAVSQKNDYESSDRYLTSVIEKIRLSGGARVNPGPLLEHRARRDASAKGLKESIDRIEGMGVQVKDLDIGLIDFLSLYDGREVCLCWKLGETGINFWHGIDEGFRGRKAIDEEFRANHEGEAAN